MGGLGNAAAPFIQFTMYRLAFVFLFIGLANGLAAETKFAPTDWPNWRGLTSDGQAPLVDGLPTEWSETKNVVWKTPIPGRGHSTPTVVGERIYLATADEGEMFQEVLCIDKADGKVVWQTKVHEGQFAIGLNKHASHAGTVVVHDGERLYVNFVIGNQAFASAIGLDGKILWQKPIGKYKVHQGYGSSPMVYRDIVVVKADTKIGGAIIGLDKKTGREIWRRERPKIPNYTTPVVVEAAGRLQMVFCGCELITSLDPLTGKKLWEVPGSTQECVSTLVTDGTHIFVSGGWPKNHTAAIVADGSGKVAWQNTARVYVPSMLFRDGFLYVTMDAGFAICWDAKTGRPQWKERLGGKFFTSPVMAGNRIYGTNLDGKTFVFEANPKEFKPIATNQLGDEVYASPIVSGNRLYLRVAFKDERTPRIPLRHRRQVSLRLAKRFRPVNPRRIFAEFGNKTGRLGCPACLSLLACSLSSPYGCDKR